MKKLWTTGLAGLTLTTLLAFGFPPHHDDRHDRIGLENTNTGDSLPRVLNRHRGDLIEGELRAEAILAYASHQLATTAAEWDKQRTSLRNKIIEKAGIVIDHNLPLNFQETGATKMDGYTVRNVIFQTRPGVYATANLYVPDGKGPFPAVINVHGHFSEGRLHEKVQARGHTLAQNGYICLSVDAFGSGERTTVHGEYEYHGANLGAHLMNVGESLLGFQVSDNMRGVDLLCSLPNVDRNNIGATGASGGGNQTMWLTAIDERIKASMPVVSVGTFESAVMRSNCICEMLVDGLTYTETSGVLALVAPRALKMCNHDKDSNPTFYPAEMKRSYDNARSVYALLGAENKIAYQTFNLTHGYWPEDREAMLGWFDLHLKGKGDGTPKAETPFKTLPQEKVMIYPKGQRNAKVTSIATYCKTRGSELRDEFLSTRKFDAVKKRNQLKEILRIDELPSLEKAHRYTALDGWNRFALQSSDDKLIPILQKPGRDGSREYVIFSHPQGKHAIASPLIDEAMQKGKGIVLLDLTGSGEMVSASSRSYDRVTPFHTLARAELWLGKSLMGEWTKELGLVTRFIRSEFESSKISIDASKEAGLAALFLGAIEEDIDEVTLRDSPTSYQFDTREGLDHFTMAIHLPGFLSWGDVSLVSALSGNKKTFINPVTMSGNPLSAKDLGAARVEFEKVRSACKTSGTTVFVNGNAY